MYFAGTIEEATDNAAETAKNRGITNRYTAR